MIGNVVYKRFIADNISDWLNWLQSVPLDSHLHMWQRFLNTTAPSQAISAAPEDGVTVLQKFMSPSNEFWEEMEAIANSKGGPDNVKKMYKVSLSLTFEDFIFELKPYLGIEEILKMSNFILRNQIWFEQFLDVLRAKQYSNLKALDKL